jgi:hypothetical protein
MKTRRLVLLAITIIGAAIPLWTACNKTDPTASSDWTINLSAIPANITITDTNTDGSTEVRALVLDKNGVVQSGVGVTFTTTSGSMSSGGNPVKTDTAGIAKSMLTASADAVVTARSGAVSKDLDIKVGGANTPPTAGITITPSGAAAVGVNVLFSGSTSEDTDGEITAYEWLMYSSNPEVGEGWTGNQFRVYTSSQAINHSFGKPMTLDPVTLIVTDNRGAHATTSTTYTIKDNLPPVAVKIPATIGQLNSSPDPYTCTVTLDCAGSSDPDGHVVACEFMWGDGNITRLTNLAVTTRSAHGYSASAVNPPYTVTLRVYDDGPGGVCPTMPTSGESCPVARGYGDSTTTVTCNERP